MPTLSQFYWRLDKQEYSHYVYDVVSQSNALEVAKTLQGYSSADLFQVDFAPVGVCLPSAANARKRFETEAKPLIAKPDLSSYKRAGDGLGLGAFLVFYFRGFSTRRAFCVPSPRRNLLDDAQAVKSAGDEMQRVVRMALRSNYAAVFRVRVLYPNAYRRAFDGLEWFPKK